MLFLPQGTQRAHRQGREQGSRREEPRTVGGGEIGMAKDDSMLSVQGLTKAFGGLVAVDNAHLELRDGQVLGLIGPNGAGKTTLFNLISGSYAPDHGRIVYRGHDIAGMKPYDICRRGIARTFQTTKPFLECTTIENVLVGALLRERNVRRARAAAEADRRPPRPDIRCFCPRLGAVRSQPQAPRGRPHHRHRRHPPAARRADGRSRSVGEGAGADGPAKDQRRRAVHHHRGARHEGGDEPLLPHRPARPREDAARWDARSR